MNIENIIFDYDKCTNCGLCIKVCHKIQLAGDGSGRPERNKEKECNDCGHCIAVCPEDAIINTNTNMADFIPMEPHNISIEMFTNLVRNRRSIRRYNKKPLSKEHLDNLLKAVNYIPTGSNKQALEYTVISAEDKLMEIKIFMAKRFQTVNNLIQSFPVRLFIKKRGRISIRSLIEQWDSGEDPFLRGAPCLIIIHTKSEYFGVSRWDAGIACNTIDIAAQTLGIGTIMIGFVMTTSRYFPALKKVVGVPKEHKIMAAIGLGYPIIKYRKTVNRRPLKVEYYE